MVMHSPAAEALHAILHDMDSSIAAIEEIIALEQAAIEQLNADEIHRLTGRRHALWEDLRACKGRCQALFQQYGMGDESELSHFIDAHTKEDAAALHEQRQQLNERIARITIENNLNAIRLKAAADSITNTLQGLGLAKAKTTYGQDGTL